MALRNLSINATNEHKMVQEGTIPAMIGTHFTRFTGTKVTILTLVVLLHRAAADAERTAARTRLRHPPQPSHQPGQ